MGSNAKTRRAQPSRADSAPPNAIKKTTRYSLILFQVGSDHIERDLVGRIQRLLDQRVNTQPDETELDLWLESPGGDAHAAFKLMVLLRSRCRNLRVVVPDYAKSAATLMTLGADTIYMSDAAELGPLDVQIPHPDRENEIVSGLDVANSLDFLSKTAVSLIINGGASVLMFTGLRRDEILSDMTKFSALFFQPAIGKLDPHLIHRASKLLKVAENYAVHLLKMRNLDTDKDAPMREDDYRDLVQTLVSSYPAHDFVICRQEAKSLGLPVCSAEEHPHWGLVAHLHGQHLHARKSLLALLSDQDLAEISSRAGLPDEQTGGDMSREVEENEAVLRNNEFATEERAEATKVTTREAS